MGLDTAKYLKDGSGLTPRLFNTELGWQEVNRGLRLVVAGYFLLLAGAAVGSGVLLFAAGEGPLSVSLLGLERGTYLVPLGVLILVAAAGGSYALVLLGQYRCLLHAPQRQNSKELMFACFLCLGVCVVQSVAGVLLSGHEIMEALRLGVGGLERLGFRNIGVLLLLGSAVLGLVASLIFSQFLRGIACCFGDQRRARQVDLNLAFVGLLVGGSVGGVISFWQFTTQATLLPWLGAGWLLCLGWHLLLIISIRRCITAGARQLSGLRKAVKPKGGSGYVRTYSLSGLRRLTRPRRP